MVLLRSHDALVAMNIKPRARPTMSGASIDSERICEHIRALFYANRIRTSESKNDEEDGGCAATTVAPARDAPFESLMFPSKPRIETDPVSSTAPFLTQKFDFFVASCSNAL
jgi:hypothetical protein